MGIFWENKCCIPICQFTIQNKKWNDFEEKIFIYIESCKDRHLIWYCDIKKLLHRQKTVKNAEAKIVEVKIMDEKNA